MFNFHSLIVVIVLVICCCSYVREYQPSLVNNKTEGFSGIFGKAAVIGDRLSPWVSLACIVLGFTTLFVR